MGHKKDTKKWKLRRKIRPSVDLGFNDESRNAAAYLNMLQVLSVFLFCKQCIHVVLVGFMF